MNVCAGGNLEVFQYFVEELHYNNFDAKSNEGLNAFMYACKYGHLSIVKYFVESLNYRTVFESKHEFLINDEDVLNYLQKLNIYGN